MGSEEKYLPLYFSNWPKSISWLPVILEILGNMCIVIICCQVCEVLNFENNFNLLIKLFLYITKKSKQKSKYLKNKKSF